MSTALARNNGYLTLGDILLLELPMFTEADHDWALWECTGWPCFWRIPHHGPTPYHCLRRQLRAVARLTRRYAARKVQP